MTKFLIESLANRGTLFAVFVVMVLFTSLFDLVGEFANGESLSEMVDDVLMFMVGALILSLLCHDFFQKRNRYTI